MIHRLIIWIGNFILKSFDFIVYKYFPNQDVFDSNKVYFDQFLQDNLQIILEEYKHVSQLGVLKNVQDFYKVETDIGQDEHWKVFPLILFNNHFVKNLNLCPKTHQILQSIPSCTSAMFSILNPGKHILPHRGLYSGVVRCLFTIEAPKLNQSWIQINGKKYPFIPGKTIYFDETYIHEVKNESDTQRVVLYMDIYRQLPFPLNMMNICVFKLLQISPFVSKKVLDYRMMTQTEVSQKKLQKGFYFK